MSAYEFSLSLRIRHPTADPASFTRELSLRPQHVWKAGDPRCTPAGEALEGTYRESYWTAVLTDPAALSSDMHSVESQLVQALVSLRRAQDFLSHLKAEGGAAEVAVEIFGRERFKLELPSDLLASLGRLGLGVSFDVQPELERRFLEL